jgi:hypothetical protein
MEGFVHSLRRYLFFFCVLETQIFAFPHGKEVELVQELVHFEFGSARV